MYPGGRGMLRVGIKNTYVFEIWLLQCLWYSLCQLGWNSLCQLGMFNSIYYIYVGFLCLAIIEL